MLGRVIGTMVMTGICMATLGIIDELEQKIGKPIVSSNSVNIWGSLKPLHIKVGLGFGQLLSSI